MLSLLWDEAIEWQQAASASGTAVEGDIYCCDERL